MTFKDHSMSSEISKQCGIIWKCEWVTKIQKCQEWQWVYGKRRDW